MLFHSALKLGCRKALVAVPKFQASSTLHLSESGGAGNQAYRPIDVLIGFGQAQETSLNWPHFKKSIYLRRTPHPVIVV